MNSTSLRALWRPNAALLLAALFVLTACQAPAKKGAASEATPPQGQAQLPPPKKVREAAVAGLFYPKDPTELAKAIDGYLEKATSQVDGRVRGLVVPHAGYEYSGPVAAFGFRLVKDAGFRTVILLAPSHYADFEGAALPDEDAFRTPLGLVRVSPQVAELAKTPPFAINPPARVMTPPWSSQSPLKVSGPETPHTWEHSEEVELPFLQRTLGDFALIPVVYGAVDTAAVAKGLLPLLDEQTLIVASSDLSHYHPYETAQQLDAACVKAVCDLDVRSLVTQEACGRAPILTLVHIAKAKGWQAKLLDCRNSGDTSGQKAQGVVGYAAIAFVETGVAAKPAAPGTFTPADRQFLLMLARQTIEARVTGVRAPAVEAGGLDEKFRARKGCFVTLTKQGELRGCIGYIFPQNALYQAVMENAVNAAVCDPRFDAVTAAELPGLELEISVLTVPEPLAFDSPEDLLKKLQPHRDGVVLSIGGAQATFLPQVWEQLPGKEEFLGHLSRKAGCAANAWRGKDVSIQIYHVEAFKESDLTAKKTE